MAAKKYFTIEQANALVPALNTELKRLQKLRYRMGMIHSSREALPELLEAVDDNGMYYYVRKELGLSKEYHKLAHEFFERLEQIVLTGAILVDLDEGSVEFPHKMAGRDVLLSWHLGERSVTHFQEIEEDAERQEFIDLDAIYREIVGSDASARTRKKRPA